MKQWEHQALEVRYDSLLAVINEQGEAGWELVQVGPPYEHIPTDENHTMYHVVWFKRKVVQ